MAVRVLTTFEHREAVFTHHHPEGVFVTHLPGERAQPPASCTLAVFLESAAAQKKLAIRCGMPFAIRQSIAQD